MDSLGDYKPHMQSHSHYKMHCVTPAGQRKGSVRAAPGCSSHRPPRSEDPALKEHKPLSAHAPDRR